MIFIYFNVYTVTVKGVCTERALGFRVNKLREDLLQAMKALNPL